MSVQTVQQTNTYLMQALNFTADDLAANRSGVMTERQVDYVKDLVAQGTRVGMIAVLIVLVITFLGVGYALFLSPADSQFSGLKENAPLVLGVFGVIMVFYILMMAVSFLRGKGMSSGKMKVKALTGKIKIKRMNMGYMSAASMVGRAAGAATTSYKISVGRETFYSTDDQAADALKPGEVYRVYVVGRKPSYIILSAEAVGAT